MFIDTRTLVELVVREDKYLARLTARSWRSECILLHARFAWGCVLYYNLRVCAILPNYKCRGTHPRYV